MTTTPLGNCGHLGYLDGQTVAAFWRHGGVIHWRLHREPHDADHTAPTLPAAVRDAEEAYYRPDGMGETGRLL